MHCPATLDLAKKLVGEIRDRLNGELELLPGLFFPVSDVFPWISIQGDQRKAGPCDRFNIVGRAGKGREPSVFASSVTSPFNFLTYFSDFLLMV